jgi:tRNA pseudouridine55 synthase
VCGRGTYVRTLAADLGAALGCGGAVESLVRTRVGPFERAQAVSSAEIRSTPPEVMWSRLLPPEAALSRWSAVRVGTRAAVAFRHGQSVEVAAFSEVATMLVRVHDESGTMLGVGELLAGGRMVKPTRILHADRPGTRVLPA